MPGSRYPVLELGGACGHKQSCSRVLVIQRPARLLPPLSLVSIDRWTNHTPAYQRIVALFLRNLLNVDICRGRPFRSNSRTNVHTSRRRLSLRCLSYGKLVYMDCVAIKCSAMRRGAQSLVCQHLSPFNKYVASDDSPASAPERTCSYPSWLFF